MDLVPHITFTRDTHGNRVYQGTRATYRIVDDHGIRCVEVHPAAGVSDGPGRDEALDVILIKINECKAYIDVLEEFGDGDMAYAAALVARSIKG